MTEVMNSIRTAPFSGRPTYLFICLLICLLCSLPWHSATAASDLPVFGDSSLAAISIEQERQLGDALMREINRSAPKSSDTQLQNFTRLLLFRLSKFSQLQDRDLRVVLIDSSTLNAFAAPGSVVGVHLGLFLEAESEDEFAAVLSHELAHLSQRHYARGKETAKKRLLPYLAGLLGSAVLLTQGNTQAGLAALHSTQAASIATQLGYSRNLEREADRIGIETLYEAGLNPEGMANMFVRMKLANRYNTAPPEFLLTHPVHESRISDARDQSAKFTKKSYSDSLNYRLMRTRAQLVYEDPEVAAANYQRLLKKALNDTQRASNQYGMALALIKAKQFEKSQDIIDQLIADDPNRLAYQLLQLELWLSAGQNMQTIEKSKALLAIHTDSLPVTRFYVDALTKEKRFTKAQQVLKRQTTLHPNNVDLWHDLAEISGLAEDIVGVHSARAEFFALRGNFKQAVQHVNSALKLIPEESGIRYRLKHRLDQLEEMEAGNS